MEGDVQSVLQADTEGEMRNIDVSIFASIRSSWKRSLFCEGGDMSSARV